MRISRDLGGKWRRKTNPFLERSFRLCILRQGVLLASLPLYFKSPLLKATFQMFTNEVRGLNCLLVSGDSQHFPGDAQHHGDSSPETHSGFL